MGGSAGTKARTTCRNHCWSGLSLQPWRLSVRPRPAWTRKCRPLHKLILRSLRIKPAEPIVSKRDGVAQKRCASDQNHSLTIISDKAQHVYRRNHALENGKNLEAQCRTALGARFPYRNC